MMVKHEPKACLNKHNKSQSFFLGGCVKFKNDPNNNYYYYYYSINRVTSPILLEKTGSFIVLKKWSSFTPRV